MPVNKRKEILNWNTKSKLRVEWELGKSLSWLQWLSWLCTSYSAFMTRHMFSQMTTSIHSNTQAVWKRSKKKRRKIPTDGMVIIGTVVSSQSVCCFKEGKCPTTHHYAEICLIYCYKKGHIRSYLSYKHNALKATIWKHYEIRNFDSKTCYLGHIV